LSGTSSAAAVLFILVSPAFLFSQSALTGSANGPAQQQQTQPSGTTPPSASPSDAGTQSATPATPPAQAPAPASPDATPAAVPATQPPAPQPSGSVGQQTTRMFWVIPNFAAVSANAQLPPLTAREKFSIAMHDSVDYSSFVWSGMLAAQSMALDASPELHGGVAGYGRYYWRAFVDQASGSFFSEALVPAITREDPRYYTRGQGGFFRRAGYALSQIVITKTDSGGESFNYSEILGDGLEAGVANLYYPPQERGLSKTAENWGTGIESAALNNLVKEFWPDIRRILLRQK
jgi:hypothetical protein